MGNQYKINFKKYRQYCKENKIAIPDWFNPNDFKKVVQLMSEGLKLQACKYLCDRSTENLTRGCDHRGFDFGLKWSKMQVCDVIDNYKVILPEPVESIKPILPKNIIHVEEVKEVLAPFKAIAIEVLNNPNLDRDQTIYAYNGAQITMADLRRVIQILDKMNEPVRWH
jgi:hypothetical protein